MGQTRYSAKQQRIRLAIEASPDASNVTIAKLTNTSLRTVSHVRGLMVKEGRIKMAYRSSSALPDPFPDDSSPTESIVLNESLTQDQKLKILDDLARNGQSEAIRIQAVLASSRLLAAEGKRDSLGPGPPLTDEDRIHRLALLLEACGKKLATEAWGRAFKPDMASANLPIIETPSSETSSNP